MHTGESAESPTSITCTHPFSHRRSKSADWTLYEELGEPQASSPAHVTIARGVLETLILLLLIVLVLLFATAVEFALLHEVL